LRNHKLLKKALSVELVLKSEEMNCRYNEILRKPVP
jgi:hypothetical protein